jgi:hypothetical protein
MLRVIINVPAAQVDCMFLKVRLRPSLFIIVTSSQLIVVGNKCLCCCKKFHAGSWLLGLQDQ